MKRKLEAWYGNSMGDLKVVIQDYCPAETKVEDDKTYHYPETIEVKFENQSNSFYSYRLSDGTFVPEGRDMCKPGLTIKQVYKRQALEAKARRERLTNGRPQ